VLFVGDGVLSEPAAGFEIKDCVSDELSGLPKRQRINCKNALLSGTMPTSHSGSKTKFKVGIVCEETVLGKLIASVDLSVNAP